MHTSFFQSLRARLAALGRRTLVHLRHHSLDQMETCLEGCLPAHVLSAEDEGPNSRERIFTLRLTFQCFVWQTLKPQSACREVVRQVQALFRLRSKGPVKEGTSAYCQARSRLPTERLEKALDEIARHADRQVGEGGRLRGRPVKVVDGSSVLLADTPENQQRYPQSSHQRPGCGFPSMKMLALFSLSSGAILSVMTDSFRSHDLRLFRQIWDRLKGGDIIVGDRLFGEYATLADLPAQEVDVLARRNARRRVDFRKGKRLGHHDGLFVWGKSKTCAPHLTIEQWAKTEWHGVRFFAVFSGMAW